MWVCGWEIGVWDLLPRDRDAKMEKLDMTGGGGVKRMIRGIEGENSGEMRGRKGGQRGWAEMGDEMQRWDRDEINQANNT